METGKPVRFFSRTPVRTFILYPLLVIAWELGTTKRSFPVIRTQFLPLIFWGYLQYRLCGSYRIKHGGGGPGLETPPERLVTSGPYAYSRNPMYLGHLIYLLGFSSTLSSRFGAALTLGVAVWFHRRILGDEKKLTAGLGEPYIDYVKSVKRWIPGIG